MSDYPPCARRQRLTKMNRDGSSEPVYRCTERSAPLMGQDVSIEDCTACPARVQITKAAMHSGDYKPTRLAEIRDIQHIAPDPNTGGWPKCKDRQIAIAGGCCGTSEHRVCNSVDCFRLGAEVTPLICGECIFRNE